MTIRIDPADLRRIEEAIARWKREHQDEDLRELARLHLLYCEVKP